MKTFNELKSMTSVMNRLYDIAHQYTTGIFSDTSWENVHNVFNQFSKLFSDFSWWVEDGGYSIDGKSKEYKGKFTVKTNYFTKVVNFRLIAYAAGTIENLWEKYDMSIMFYLKK